jgi:aspartate carbamoyltransferase catalytic subunit
MSAKNFAGGTAIRSCASDSVIGLWFLDSSTRTRLGFEVAALRLGVKTFHISQKKLTERMSNEESFEDTLRVLSDYSDVLCIRGEENFIEKLSGASCPIINCGNGDDEHPTQALVDIFTIHQLLGRIDGLRICIVGDLRHMRTAHSFVSTLKSFNNLHIDLVGPSQLQMPDVYLQGHSDNSITRTEIFSEVAGYADVIYMTGFTPHTPVGTFEDEDRLHYQLNTQLASIIRKDAIVLCPLPRIDEITTDIDAIEQAAYFTQSKLGLFMRMAILSKYIS